MTYALELEGIQSLSFSGAKDALEYLIRLPKQSLPCLIIVDFMMPEIDGGEFISLLKDQYPNSLGNIPTVLSTARLIDEIDHIPLNIPRLEKPVELNAFLRMAREYYFREEFNSQVYL